MMNTRPDEIGSWTRITILKLDFENSSNSLESGTSSRPSVPTNILSDSWLILNQEFREWLFTRVGCGEDAAMLFWFLFTLVTGPRGSFSLKLSDTRVYEPPIRARLGTTAYFRKGVVLR